MGRDAYVTADAWEILPEHVGYASYTLALNSKYRVEVTPAKRGKGRTHQKSEDKIPEQRLQTMTWAQRLKRVFNIDVSV